jgi:hypothetical protein
MSLYSFASAEKGALASPAVTSAAINNLVVIMVGSFLTIDRENAAFARLTF